MTAEVDPIAPLGVGPSFKARLRSWDWPTIWLFAGCLFVWGGALMLPDSWALVRFVGVALALVLHASLAHEIIHGHPFRSARAGDALGMVQLGLAIPYLRFKRTHLAHHMDANLTDPYDDPETNFMDPAIWSRLTGWQRAVLRFNNTLLGRMLVGPVVSQWFFMCGDWQSVRAWWVCDGWRHFCQTA